MNSVLLVIPVELLVEAAIMAAQLSGNDSDSDPSFFSRDLEDIASGNITHKLASTAISDNALNALPGLSSSFPGAHWVLYTKTGSRAPEVDIDQWLENIGLRLKE